MARVASLIASHPPAQLAVDVVVAGAGPVGLLTALAIKRRLNRSVHVFEAAHLCRSHSKGVVTIYPNGFRALALIDPELPALIEAAGSRIDDRKYIR
jgi:2-polyprenyl-6-methoxyphenol hydroxylase-like FAD-dependent oxidoreductase